MNTVLLKENFEKRRFKTAFFSTAEEARTYLLQEIHDTDVASGGSMTLADMGLLEDLSKTCNIFSHVKKEDRENFVRELTAEVFICSANGISETGEIINIDGTGNRVVGTLYGHERCYIVAGRNKIAPTLAEAWQRAKDTAAPLNCIRLNKKTPCAVNGGKCHDCSSPDRICNGTVILERPMKGMTVEVVFIDEDLGF